MNGPPEPVFQAPEAILQRIADELVLCEAMLLRIETAALPVLATHLPKGKTGTLQDFDLLGQSLADLARCLRGLAGEVRDANPIDTRRMLAPLHLEELAQRLDGRSPAPQPIEARVALF